MKKLILIIGVGVLILVGGIGGWFLFGNTGNTQEEKGRKKSKSAIEEKMVYHEMKPFLVNLADPGGKRYLKLTMELEIPDDPELTEELTDKEIEIRDAILMFLSSLEVDDISLPAGKMTLKKTLTRIINRILKTGKVEGVYFTEFLIQ